jgi:hypothetical protein
MSNEPFNLSADLKRLRDEGYFVQIRGGFLIMRDVPFVDSKRQVRLASLISSLNMAGDVTQKPDTHVVYFDDDFPCDAEGNPISRIAHKTQDFNFGHGIIAKHEFSSKPQGGYADYYEKMTTYASIISAPAMQLKPDVNPRTFRVPEDEDKSIFNYTETASDRVGIGALTERLSKDIIAIIGLGGSGSYTLDFVAKTPVPEIRLFDSDEFLQHNAFRAPGAPSIEELRQVQKKVDYLKAIYSKMHRGIVTHESLNADNLHLLDGVTFAFISMDPGDVKRLIIEKLESIGASFVDVGMGLDLEEGALNGILRVTTSTPEKRDHTSGRICTAEKKDDDIYASNIQVADLNALNAVLAVIKWKKLRGFYHDLEREHNSTYTIDGNQLENGDKA